MNKRSFGLNPVRNAALIGSATLLFVSVCAEIPSAFGASMLQSNASQGSSAISPGLPLFPSEPPLPDTVPPRTNPPAIFGPEYVIPFRSPDPELAEFLYRHRCCPKFGNSCGLRTGDCIEFYSFSPDAKSIVDGCWECWTQPPTGPEVPFQVRPPDGSIFGGVGGGVNINGMGGDSRKNDLLRPGDVAGPSAATNTPVLAASGFKVETVDEVVVELPGQDFVLSRSFSGSSRLIKSSAFGPHALGGWMLSTDVQVVPMLTSVEVESTGDNWLRAGYAAYVAAPVQQSVLFQNLTSYFPELQVNPAGSSGGPGAEISTFLRPGPDPVGRRTFRPMGPGLHRLVADRFTSRDPVVPTPAPEGGTSGPITTIRTPFVPSDSPEDVTLPVWRLVDPGNGTSIFFRGDPTSAAYRSGLSRTSGGGNLFDDVATQTDPDQILGRLCRGYLWQQIDAFGNSWYYEYTKFQTDSNSNEPRLTAVYLHGKSATDPNTRAIVRFYWDVVRARDGRIVNDSMNSVTAGLGAANGNSLRIRLVTVERPVENASEGASSRSWIVTDRVEYYYRGNVQENATAQSSASYRGLGDAGDLAMVISRNRLPLPEARQQPSSAGAAKWRTRVYQYRYTNALKPVGQSTFVVSKQIRAIFSPEQIELLAIQNPTLGGVQPLVAGDAGVEGVAWSILGLPDRTELTFGSGTNPPKMELWSTAAKWITYYDHPSFHKADGAPDDRLTPEDQHLSRRGQSPGTSNRFMGQVHEELLMPGPHGHTLRKWHRYSEDDDSPISAGPEIIRALTHRHWAVDQSMVQRHRVTLRPPSSILIIEEFTRTTDERALLPGVFWTIGEQAWKPRRRITHRSEHREIFSFGWAQHFANSSSSTWMIAHVPFTVAERVDAIESAPSGGVSVLPGHTWLTYYEFDEHNRPWRTYDPGALRRFVPGFAGAAPDEQVNDRLSNLGALARQRYLTPTSGSGSVPAFGEGSGSISTVVYADYVQPSEQAENFLKIDGDHGNLRGREYRHNYPASMRVAARFIGARKSTNLAAPEDGSFQLNETEYLRSGEPAGPNQRFVGLLATPIRGLNWSFDAPGDRPDLPTRELQFATEGGSPSPEAQGVQRTMYEWSLRTGVPPAPEALGFVPVSEVVVRREREGPEENGPSGTTGTVSSRSWIDSFGRVSATKVSSDDSGIDQPFGTAYFYGYDGSADLIGRPTKVQTGVDISAEGVAMPGPDTKESRATYDVSGTQIRSIDVNGVSTDTYFSVESLPARSGASPGSNVQVLVATLLPHEWAEGSSARTLGAATREWYNAANRVLLSTTNRFEGVPQRMSGSGAVVALPTFNDAGRFSRQEADYAYSGVQLSSRSWVFASSGGLFPNIDPASQVAMSSMDYDGDGSPVRTQDPLNNIVKTEYDSRGRPVKILSGISGSTAPKKLVEERYYDLVETGSTLQRSFGDGLLTLVRVHPGAGQTSRGTRFVFDHRKRQIAAYPVSGGGEGSLDVSPTGPASFSLYDNLDRVVASATLSAESTLTSQFLIGLRSWDSLLPGNQLGVQAVGVTRSFYSRRGFPYRTQSYIGSVVGQANQAKWSTVDRWFDGPGREIAVSTSGAPTIKSRYDSTGLLLERRSVIGGTESYIDAANINKGFGLEQVLTEYLPVENLPGLTTTLPNLTTKRVRLESDLTPSSPLSDGMPAELFGTVSTYVATLYDGGRRPTATVNYGTNEAASVGDGRFKSGPRPSVYQKFVSSVGLQLPSDVNAESALVSRVFYDARGVANATATRMPDPSGSAKWRVDRTFTDSLGRAYAIVENSTQSLSTESSPVDWVAADGVWRRSGTPPPSPDLDRLTTHVFDLGGQTTRSVAHVPSSLGQGTESLQITEYRFGNGDSLAPSGSDEIESNSLLRQIRYPDATTGLPGTTERDRVSFGYNRLGEQVRVIDQNQTERAFTRDPMGRVIADTVQVFGVAPFLAPAGESKDWQLDRRVSQIVTKFDPFGRVKASASTSWFAQPATAEPPTFQYQVSDNISPSEPWTTIRASNKLSDFVEYEYDSIGLVTKIRQSAIGPESAVPADGVREVRLGYDIIPDGSAATNKASIRHAFTVYPDRDSQPSADDTVLHYLYNNPFHGAINRPTALATSNSVQPPLPNSGMVAAYTRLGSGAFVSTSLGQFQTQTTRRSAQSGDYTGWDRFGRLRDQTWTRQVAGPAGATRQGVWSEVFRYDARSRKVARDSELANWRFSAEDWRYEYDRLDRVIKADRGQVIPDATPQSLLNLATLSEGSKAWTLDALGNWGTEATRGADGLVTSETRSHNANNEITSVGEDTHRFDSNGNLVEILDSADLAVVRERLRYDAWNRLVLRERPFAELEPPVTERVAHRYNGLHWRIEERLEYAGSPLAQHVRRYMFYSQAWQLLAEEVRRWNPNNLQDPDTTTIEHQFWGLRNTDEAVMRRIDRNANGLTDDPPNPTTNFPGDDAYVQLVDSSMSVVAHVDALTGQLRQRMSYDSFGRMRLILNADIDGNGRVDEDDLSIFATQYVVEVGLEDGPRTTDFNGDGVVDDGDLSLFAQWYDDQTGDKPARDAVRVAYHGYIPEHATLMYIGDETRMTRYLGRMRWYDARLGRWLTRDPAGYVDGLNVYLFVRGNPLSFVDPSGLQSEKWAQEPAVDAETGAFLGTHVWDENDVSKPVQFYPKGTFHKALTGNPDHCPNAMLRQDKHVGQAIADIQDATAEFQATSNVVLEGGKIALESGPMFAAGVTAAPQAANKLADAAKLARRLNSGDFAKATGRGIALMKTKGSLAVGWKLAPKAGDIGAYGTARYKAITGNNYRHNLKVFTGGEPAGHHAHHVLTQAMVDEWQKKFPGVNIHDPRYLEWRPKAAHTAVSKAYEKQMRSFMEKRPNASIEKTMEFGKKKMDELIDKYNQRENR